VRALDVQFDDPGSDDDEHSPGPSFYYARVFQVDGELAWSSPIWVSRGAVP
jgi:hypothetical protein